MAGKAFPRQARLLTPADFKRVFEQATASSDGLFRVLARPGETPRSRLGMAVSRKVDSRASVRNRIKRVIRESFRSAHSAHAAAPDGSDNEPRQSLDYVVLATPAAARASNARLAKSLERHWSEVERKLGSPRNGRR